LWNTQPPQHAAAHTRQLEWQLDQQLDGRLDQRLDERLDGRLDERLDGRCVQGPHQLKRLQTKRSQKLEQQQKKGEKGSGEH